MVAQSIRSSQWMRQALRHFEQFAHFETDLHIPDAKILEVRKREAIDCIDTEGLRTVSAALA